MSTQITGPYDPVMNVLKSELVTVLRSDGKVAVVIKLFNEGLDLEWLEH